MKKKKLTKEDVKKYPTLDLRTDRDIGMDFAVRAYKKFDKIIKSIILFGSSAKNTASSTSDVDVIIVIDDASIIWDQELIAWYREELGKIVETNPYKKDLHINTIKVTTWWSDLIKGDPVIINVLRYGEALIDFAGFFSPVKALLSQGRIKHTPEAIYMALQRAPEHYRRSKLAEIGSIDGLYWAMVDSGQAALMSINILSPSPEHIPILLKENFVDKNMLDIKYASWFKELYVFYKQIYHGNIKDVKGNEVDLWQQRTDEFIGVMIELVNKNISK